MLLGIDIGGTNISLGLVDNDGIRRIDKHPSFSPDAPLEETLNHLEKLIDNIMNDDVSSIGIGVPSIVDPDKGIVYEVMNIPSWKKVPLAEILEKRYHVPVRINNDSNCFALGAYHSLPEEKVLVGVTLGTGLGVGIIDNGRIFCGAHLGAGEIGCLSYIGGNMLESFCSKQFFENMGTGCLEVCSKAQHNDREALAILEDFGMHMGRMLALVMYAYDPSCIVLGGGVANAYPYFKTSMEKSIRENFVYKSILEKMKIRILSGDDIAILGASML